MMTIKTGVITTTQFKWWKPWTWRNGARKGDTIAVSFETVIEELLEADYEHEIKLEHRSHHNAVVDIRRKAKEDEYDANKKFADEILKIRKAQSKSEGGE